MALFMKLVLISHHISGSLSIVVHVAVDRTLPPKYFTKIADNQPGFPSFGDDCHAPIDESGVRDPPTEGKLIPPGHVGRAPFFHVADRARTF